MQLLLMYRSLTYAQRCVKLLEREGIPASVARAPKALSGRGCGYCAVINEKYGTRAAEILRRRELLPERVFRRGPDGSAEEASL